LEVSLKGTKYFKQNSSKEYLVSITKLIEFMEDFFDYKLLEYKSFQDLCSAKFCEMMNDDEKAFSFMNCFLVFEKQ